MYMHRTQFRPQSETAKPLASQTSTPRASDEHLDQVYHSFLETLSLSESHTQSLQDRGLDKAAIQLGAYRSSPTASLASEIVEKVGRLGLGGVPGFCTNYGKWVVTKIPSGILIPIRNSTRQICGIQIRLDDPLSANKYIWFSSSRRDCGTSSGAPIHWCKPELVTTTRELLITEGALKASVIGRFLDVPVIGAAGVRSFGRNFATTFKANYPNTTVVICFDSDWRSKVNVRNALSALRGQLTDAGVQWRVRCWSSEYKGYDDYLLAQFRLGITE